MKKQIRISTLVLSLVLCLGVLSGCGKSAEKGLPGNYGSQDGQVLILGEDKSVQYMDIKNSDSSSGTWEIEGDKVIIHRETPNGIKRRDISAEIPEGEIESLYFEAVEGSEGSGRFNAAEFIRVEVD